METPRARSSAAWLASWSGIGDADVGQAVGQQQAAVDAAVDEVAGDLFAAAQPALAEVGAAPRVDGAQPLDGAAARLGRGGRGLDDHVDDVVVDHDAEPVVGPETRDGLLDRDLGDADLLAGHRPGPVEHDREVDRRAFPFGRRARGGDAGQDEALAVGRSAG